MTLQRNDVAAAQRPQQTRRHIDVARTGHVKVCKPSSESDPVCPGGHQPQLKVKCHHTLQCPRHPYTRHILHQAYLHQAFALAQACINLTSPNPGGWAA